MSRTTERKQSLAERWYTGPPPGPGWRVLSGVYCALVAARRGLYRLGWLPVENVPVPLVVVGNITAGGSGKTPLVIALVEALRAHGFSPGVVSRGYGGTQRKPLLLGAEADPVRCGDEPCLIQQRCQVPVAIGRDRVAAARLLPGGVDVIVSDDGLQHYRMGRDIEICVIDGVRRFGNARMLPAGPLREPLSRLAEVDYRISNGGVAEPGGVVMLLHDDVARKLHQREQCVPLTEFAGTRVHAVAGIGDPARFFDSLRRHGIEVVQHAFADHHRFVAGDLDFQESLPLLMTEKDAVKCARLSVQNAWVVPVRAELPGLLVDDIVARLRRAQSVP